MLSLAIFLPLATGLLLLLAPASRPRLARWIALAGALAIVALALALALAWDGRGPAIQARNTLPWIPPIGATYDVGITAFSLPLILLTATLFAAVMVHVLRDERRARAHAFLFLLMETGLLGLFAAQDLLLFYLFFEVGLVPMYFIIGLFGHERRRQAALKFFLYTRAASLAMLLAFLGLYLASEPRTFSLPALAAARPLAGARPAEGLVLLGMLLGFGVKLPAVPIHNWLPDAHVEAPTEGSVILAGLHLKMGGFGLVHVAVATVPGAVARYAWPILTVAILSIVYGALAALAQRDFKRLVAYTSINHMGFVLLGVAAWALAADPTARALALSGAVYQMVSHGLLTGGMFFMVGVLQDQAHARALDRFGGLAGTAPRYAALLGLLAFGSLGIPGLSGFVAELQVLGAAVAVSVWAAGAAALGIAITTGLYIRVLLQIVMGEAPAGAPRVSDPPARRLAVAAALGALALLLGVIPGPLVRVLAVGAERVGPPAPLVAEVTE